MISTEPSHFRSLVDDEFASGEMVFRPAAVASLAESLLQRSAEGDMAEESATERLAEGPTVPRFALYDVQLLRMRALLARARGDEPGHREFVERYRAMATSLGFEGHVATAAAMASGRRSSPRGSWMF